jgi:hypothetical protein
MILMGKKVKQQSDSIRDIRLKSLKNYEPYLPVITNSICHACGKTGNGLWHQLRCGLTLKHLCGSCFRRWFKLFYFKKNSCSEL